MLEDLAEAALAARRQNLSGAQGPPVPVNPYLVCWYYAATPKGAEVFRDMLRDARPSRAELAALAPFFTPGTLPMSSPCWPARSSTRLIAR